MSDKNEKEIRFRTSEEFFARIIMDCDEKRISRKEYMNSILGKHFANQEGNLSLFLNKFQKSDKSLEKLELKIDGLTRMLVYFVQFFFLVHPTISENFAESTAYLEASRQGKTWIQRIWKEKCRTNSDFVNEVLNVLLFEETIDGQNEKEK